MAYSFDFDSDPDFDLDYPNGNSMIFNKNI